MRLVKIISEATVNWIVVERGGGDIRLLVWYLGRGRGSYLFLHAVDIHCKAYRLKSGR